MLSLSVLKINIQLEMNLRLGKMNKNAEKRTGILDNIP